MNIKIFSIAVIVFASIHSSAIVHVGNGGGDAENKILQMSPLLSLWAKACNENLGLCGDHAFSEYDIQTLSRKVFFAPKAQITNYCASETVLLSHESLYLNLDLAKSNSDLAEVLIKSLLLCANWSTNQLDGLKINFTPLAKTVTKYSLFVFNGINSDILVSAKGEADIQTRLQKSMSCHSYRLISTQESSLTLKCVDNDLQYLVFVTEKVGYGVELRAKIDSE